MRQIVGEEHTHFSVTRYVNCHGTFYLGNRGQDYLFPLYLYPENSDQGRLSPEIVRQPNLDAVFLKAFAANLNLPQEEPFGLPKGVTAEDIFDYAYAPRALLKCNAFCNLSIFNLSISNTLSSRNPLLLRLSGLIKPSLSKFRVSIITE